MSFGPRPAALPSHIRASSGFGQQSSQQTALQRKIEEKKAELESLKQLRDLSAGLVGQMEQLEEKLSTLSDGTEAVAAVLGNWGNVLRAIHMASARIPRPKDAEGGAAEENGLPQTLVRIPIQQAEEVQATQKEQSASDG